MNNNKKEIPQIISPHNTLISNDLHLLQMS